MQNQQKEKINLKQLPVGGFVLISKEDKKRADEFLERSGSKNLNKRGKEKPVFSCDYCQKEFSYSSNLKQHVKIHTGQKDHHCNLCDYSATCKRELQDHIRIHLKERPFKCQEPNCGASFATTGTLRSHQLVHKKRDKKFFCSACRYKTHAKSCLTCHMKNVHSDSRPFKCLHENCDYSAKEKTTLNRHSKIHSQDKNEVCPHQNCEFRTKWAKNLKVHLETHSNGEKKYKCGFCSYSSHHHSNLVVHIRRHTQETPFFCQLCPYKSKTKSHLNRHMKTH